MYDPSHANQQFEADRQPRNLVKWIMLGLSGGVALYVVALLYVGGQVVVGSIALVTAGLALYVYGTSRALSYRYLFPGLAGIAVFILLPLVFTVFIGFTNYSSRNLLTFERATQVLLSQRYRQTRDRLEFKLYRDGDGYRLVLTPERPPAHVLPSIFDTGVPRGDGGEDAHTDDRSGANRPLHDQSFVTDAFDLARPGQADGQRLEIPARPLEQSTFTPGHALPMADIMALRRALHRLDIRLPDGTVLVESSLRAFAAEAPVYVRAPGGKLRDQQTGAILTPDFKTGFYTTDAGDTVTPGFRIMVGFDHYVRIFTDKGFRAPFLRIFAWTVMFAGLSVLLTLIVGVLLGELLEWEGLRLRGLARVLLFLPYAVPGFISILVFKGLFNENFGEINHIVDMVFGIKPRWFSQPTLAKIMLLVVNTWLGYPYIMLLWMGLRKSVPTELYEDSAMTGAGPMQNFFYITWPLVKKPLTPLLVSSFAFNFNNFVLIALLTGGRPDFLDTAVPAGTNDILVSYTYRIAFQDSGQNFGLAGAISTVIFIMVALLSYINLRLTKAHESVTGSE